jgi:hypothetical protein
MIQAVTTGKPSCRCVESPHPLAGREVSDKGSMSEIAWLHQLTKTPSNLASSSAISLYCSFAYSALASFRMGMSGSASFHSLKKS